MNEGPRQYLVKFIGDGRREHDGLRSGSAASGARTVVENGGGAAGQLLRDLDEALGVLSPRPASKTTEGPELTKMRTATRLPPASTVRETCAGAASRITNEDKSPIARHVRVTTEWSPYMGSGRHFAAQWP
jgi:hypothetical protein